MNTIKSRCYVFTCNNPSPTDVVTWRSLVERNDKVRFVGFGFETGDSGTTHMQGVLCWTTGQTMVACKKIDARAHFEKMRGTFDEAVTYCKKDGVYEEYGTQPPGQGKRTDIDDLWADMREDMPMAEVADKHFGQFLRYSRGLADYRRLKSKPRLRGAPMILWLWGPTGTKKTLTMRALVSEHMDNTYFLNGSVSGTWWYGYNTQRIVVMDDLRGNWMPHHQLLRVLDSTPMTVAYKGGTQVLVADIYIITTNRSPNELYENDPAGALARRVADFAWVYEVYKTETRVWSWPNVHGKSCKPLLNYLTNK